MWNSHGPVVKAIGLLPEKVWGRFVGLEQIVPADGKAA
jgi:hypothetical protein